MLALSVSSISAAKVIQFKRPMGTAAVGPLKLFAGGNVEGRKGVSLALRALAIVASKGVDFHYTVAGGGPEIASLQALATQLMIADQVEFHPGFHGDAYPQALWAADVYLLPSFRETMGMTMVEAMLAGCYPVVADTSAQGEIVRMAGGHAVPVTTMDELVRGLADAILWCHAQRPQLSALAAQSIPKLTAYFAAERYDEVIQSAYHAARERSASSIINRSSSISDRQSG